MSTMLLVRHAQATPFEADTDHLTALGVHQAETLADFWIETGVEVDEIHTGTLERQVRTATLVAGRMHAAGRPWPEGAAAAGFNEYDGDGIFGVLAQRLAGDDADFRMLLDAAREARGTPEQNRHFQRMIEYVADRWQRGDLVDPAVEPWPDFCARVDAAVDRVLDGGSGRRVAVFTSGGVIGRTLQRVLRAPDETALALNWRVRNASLTQLTFSGRRVRASASEPAGGDPGVRASASEPAGGHVRVSLDTFNVTTHLQAAGLDTYR